MLLGLKKSIGKYPLAKSEVLTNAQMREADRLTIEGGTPGYELMTAAGQAVSNIVHKYYPDHDVLILCGPGNNGGDGFVAALFLEDLGHKVSVMSLVPGRKLKGDAKLALKDWGGKILDFKARPDLSEKTVVIDAVFGTGLSKALEAPVTEVFDAIRNTGWPVVAVDIPSGVNGDTAEVDPATLDAAQTVTFFRKKIGHILMPGQGLCGNITVHDIGIDDDILKATDYSLHDNVPPLWVKKIPPLKQAKHKYSRGHVVMLGGGRMTGAVRMASEAAMRTGAGLCTIVSPSEAVDVYKKAAPHVMVELLKSYEEFILHLQDERRNTVLMGPGAGLDNIEGLQKAVLMALKTQKPIVLDADALTCFTASPEMLFKALHERCVLTPHEGEFSKLFPNLHGSKLEKAETATKLTKAVILLKGPDTIIAQHSQKTTVNTHATPYLATAGAGDVLAGIISGLIAQGMGVYDASCAGAWIHGEAAIKKGAGLVAPDIIDTIPAVLRELAV